MKNIYCIHSLDRNKIIEKRKEIIKNLGVDEFNISIFDMDDCLIKDVLNDLSSFPFMSEYRVVVLTNCSFLLKAKKEDKENNDLTGIFNYIMNPSTTSIFIMEVEAENLDTKNKIVSYLKENSFIVNLKVLSKEEITKAFKYDLERRNLKINQEAFDEAVLRLSSNPLSYQNEIEKLFLYYSDGEQVEVNIVKKLLTKEMSNNIFDLTNAIRDRDKKKALRLYLDFIKEGENPLMISSIVTKKFIQLMLIKEMVLAGYNKEDIQEYLKVSSGQLYFLMNEARDISYERLEKIINNLKDLDYNSKIDFKYGDDKDIGFEMFLLNL